MADRWMRRFWRVKYRLDLGNSFVPIINFAMLSVTTAKVLGFRAYWGLIIGAPIVLLVIWGWGYFLEKKMGAQEHIEDNLVSRQPQLRGHYEQQQRIEDKLDKIIEARK